MKNFKKVIAAVSVTAVGVASLAGCTRMPKSTSMFDVMKNASELEKFTYEVSFSMDAGNEMMDVTFMGESDGNATSLGFKAMMNGIKYEIEQAMIVSGSVMYFNVGSFMSLVATTEDVDFSEMGITCDWISIDIGEDIVMNADNSLFLDAFDKAYDYIIEETDGVYEIRISSDEDLVAFVDATINLLEDNADDFAKEIADSYNEVDYVNIVKNVMVDLVKDVNKHVDAGKTDSEIEDLFEEIFAEVDTSELEIDADEIEDTIIEMAEDMEENKDELSFEGGPDKITISSYQEDESFVFEIKAVGESEGEKQTVKMTTTVTADNSVAVKIPDKDVQTLGEVICAVIDESGITAEQFDELLEEIMNTDLSYITGVTGSDILGETVKPDIDYGVDILDDLDEIEY